MSWWLSKGSVPARAFALPRTENTPSADSLSAPVRRVSWALEPFDESEQHAQRVADLAVWLGTELGLGGIELAGLRQGARLHDVGKRALPSSLLRKTGPLTKGEWAQMRRHPELGREWARRHGVEDKIALDVILHHHERWDGGGYPMGLGGDHIPRGARIVALCDVFDALMSERRYKAAWSLDRTLTYLAERGGAEFDPELTRVFVGRIMAAV